MIPKATRDLVWSRADSCCEHCGQGLTRESSHSVHHRKYLSRGGTDHISNLVLLCGTGVAGCHGLVHSTQEIGFTVSRYANPQTVPILHWSREYRFLLPTGEYGEIVWEAS